MKTIIQRIVLEAGIIFALGVVLGLSINAQLVLDAFSGRLTSVSRPVPVEAPPARTDARVPARLAFPTPVLLDDVQELLRSGAVVIDARSPEAYAEGHLPKAVSLPLGDVDALLVDFEDKIAKEVTLIAYCSGFGCPDSFDIGMRLLEVGYTDVRVYEGGLPEWRDAGLPIEKGAP